MTDTPLAQQIEQAIEVAFDKARDDGYGNENGNERHFMYLREGLLPLLAAREQAQAEDMARLGGIRDYLLRQLDDTRAAWANALGALERERATPVSKTVDHEWQFYMNGTFCRRCGMGIGSRSKCRL